MKPEPHPKLTVLLVDDKEDFLNSMKVTLKQNGITNVECCQDSRNVMPLLKKKKFSLILLDILMPGKRGDELLPEIVEECPEIPVIMLTALDNVKTAFECIKKGAFDYLLKSFETPDLIKKIQHILDLQDVKKENIRLRDSLFSVELKNPDAFSEIVTQDSKMNNIFKYIEAIAESRLPVLITGKTGTGKELIARAIHKASGRKGNFVGIKLGGLSHNKFLSELFGYKNEKNAGSDDKSKLNGLVKQAEGGTLFLDEIGDISIRSQVVLFRLIQEREYPIPGSETRPLPNIRLVAASNRELKTMMKKGDFRKDLYHRMHHKIHLPPLKERKGDLPLLVDYFLKLSAKKLNKKMPRVPKDLYTLLSNYDFPGNIRELGIMVCDAVRRHQSGVLSLEVFREKIGQKEMAGVKG